MAELGGDQSTALRASQGGGDKAYALTASAGHHGHSSPRGDGGDNLVATWDERNVTSATNRSEVEFGKPSHILHQIPPAIIGAGVRRLTPRECNRLQGFPDDWDRWDAAGTELADSHRYRLMGNAVCVPVAAWLGRRLLAFA